MHVMWYELEMLPETLNSLEAALQYSTIPVDITICFNKQTYLETPILDNLDEQFDLIRKHPVLRNATIIEKTDAEDFYNVGDWRREIRIDDGYTIWGESDTLIPIVYFPLLEQIAAMEAELVTPHVVTLASRKMWDDSWLSVEHPSVRDYISYPNGKSNAPSPLGHDQYISQTQLDELNSAYLDNPGLTVVYPPKLDGSMVALHPKVPQLIAEGIRVVSEDFCAQMAIHVLNIPQYHISNIFKGHNYHHPQKRTNTIANRNQYGEVVRGGGLFEKLRAESTAARERFIMGLLK